MISIIIPAYNEEGIIGKTIDDIISVLKKNHIYRKSEIIVINDGSKDNTKEEVIKRKVRIIDNPSNMGYGYSLKKGILAAKGETIVTLDADGTYPFYMIVDLLKEKDKGFDLVVGARTGKYYYGSIIKYLLRKIMKFFVQFISGKEIIDINSGFRVFDKTTIIKYYPKLCDTFSFTTSQTLAYMMDSLFVCYVNTPYYKRYGKTKVKILKDSIKSLRYILECGIYYNPLKIFSTLSFLCIILSIIGFIVSHYFHINVGYILGIAGILMSIVILSIGLLAVLLKQIMDK